MKNHFDVVIVGAGLSGIGAARQIKKDCPQKSFTILESRNSMGGTWDLFQYPGIRSDSDMFTMGYASKPWMADDNIASPGPSILSYIKDAAREKDIESHIQYNQKVKTASWSSKNSTWTLSFENSDSLMTCSFLLSCSGYYNFDKGYTPEFEGIETFGGKVIHPQHWPKDLNIDGKRIVIIGSGATAVTLLPSLAEKAGHVTMLQRSPTYMISMPKKDPFAMAAKFLFSEKTAHHVIRLKNIYFQRLIYICSRKFPEQFKKLLIKRVRNSVNADIDVKKHFTPKYAPWDQRMCLVPGADFFEALNSKKASIVTDKIQKIQNKGIQLASGEFIEADIIVTATGLDLNFLGGIRCDVDGKPINFSETFTYKGLMLSTVPNLIYTFGYVNASWALRSELVAQYCCRLLNHMDQAKVKQCTPQRGAEPKENSKPMIENFSSGYLQRKIHLLPKQGQHEPWTCEQNYLLEKKQILKQPVENKFLTFS